MSVRLRVLYHAVGFGRNGGIRAVIEPLADRAAGMDQRELLVDKAGFLDKRGLQRVEQDGKNGEAGRSLRIEAIDLTGHQRLQHNIRALGKRGIQVFGHCNYDDALLLADGENRQ